VNRVVSRLAGAVLDEYQRHFLTGTWAPELRLFLEASAPRAISAGGENVTEPANMQDGVPLEMSIPQASLESILCTEELLRRRSRPPDYESENRALVALGRALADSPRTILQTLSETILEITESDSAGLSLLTRDGKRPDACGKRFYWPAIAGMWKPHVGGGTPRNFGPCGDVLDHNRTLLFKHFERRYPYLQPVIPAAEECLLVPFYVGGKAVGTIWAIMHSNRRKFDAEDERVMGSLEKFASSAYQAVMSIDDLRVQIAEREKAEIELRELSQGLETQVRLRTEELEQRNKQLAQATARLDEEKVALERSEAYLAEAQRLSRTGSWHLNVNTGEVQWSKEFFAIFGFDPERAKPSYSLNLERIHPEDRQSVEELRRVAIREKKDLEVEYRVLLPGRSIKYVLSIAHCLTRQSGEIEYIGAVMDITERKRAERELLALRDELAAELTAMTRLHELSTHLLEISEFQPLLEEVLDATIALQNADFGNIQLYDPETQALEIVAQRGFHQDFLEYFGNVRDTGAACGRAMDLGERVIIEDVETDSEFAPHRHIAASAGFRAVQSTPLFSRSSEFLGMLSTHFRRPHRPLPRDLRFTDLYARHAAEIIDRKRLDEARRQAEQALHRTQVELARVSRLTTMGALAASIAHEVNQPLSGIITNASTCLRMLSADPPNVDGASETARRTIRDANRASEVITRLRTLFSKKEAATESVNLNEAAREVIALSLSDLQRNGVILRTELADNLPLVTGDRVQIQQVILNILGNASDAMSCVDDRPRQLLIRTERDEGAGVVLAVQDAGVGFDSQAADRLFESFYTTKNGGMGVGLSVSRTIIESHNGRLWGTLNDGPGATFRFSIPCERKGMTKSHITGAV